MNKLCPCGSGKEYERCCGLITNPKTLRTDYIKINQAVAYSGSLGKTRKTFCEEYIQFKKAKISQIQSTLAKDVESRQLTISCNQGCSHCCSQFIVVSLQEAESIVFFLYKNETVMKNFLANYPDWLVRAGKTENTFTELTRLCQLINSGKAGDRDLEDFNVSGKTYAELDNPCPFLVDKSCSIYEVRPFVCANYFSVTQPDWCRPGSREHKKSIHVKMKLLGRDLPYFIPLTRNRILHPVPVLVHRILEEGYGAISSITGRSGLKHEALSDPEIRAALQRALASN